MFYAAPGRVGHSGVAVIEANRNVGDRSPIVSRSGGDVTSRRDKMRDRVQGRKIEDIPREVGPHATNCTSYGGRIPPANMVNGNFDEIRSTWNVPRRICGRLEYLYKAISRLKQSSSFAILTNLYGYSKLRIGFGQDDLSVELPPDSPTENGSSTLRWLPGSKA